MIRDVIFFLIFVWMIVLSATLAYVLKAEHEFLVFADMMVDDNLKNVVKSGGRTYLVVDMSEVDIGRPDLPVKLYAPMYMHDEDMEKMVDWKQKMYLMVRDFEKMDMDAKIAAAKAGAYFKKRLKEVQARKEKTDAVSAR